MKIQEPHTSIFKNVVSNVAYMAVKEVMDSTETKEYSKITYIQQIYCFGNYIQGELME